MVSVNLVTWNGRKYLQFLVESLANQTFKDWRLVVLDNGSTDDTVKVLKEELAKHNLIAEIFLENKNLGFAAGHNKLFNLAFGEAAAKYCLALNQDIILEPDYLEKLVNFMDSHSPAAAATGRLMRWDFENNLKTNLVDSPGLKVFRNRRVVDWGGGLAWAGSAASSAGPTYFSNQVTEVFGVSGAAPLYRKSALQEVAYQGQVFDEDFFSYKEDVDLAWRLRLAGFSSFLIPPAVAYHARSVGADIKRTRRSGEINYYSYRNHILTLIKNEFLANYLIDYLPIKWYELKKILYLLFFEPRTLRAWADVIRLWPRLRAKRRYTMGRRKVDWREVRRWWQVF